MNSFRLTVVYLSILQHKLVHSTCTVSFPVGVATTDKVKWLRTDLTAFTVSQQTLILSATTHCTLRNQFFSAGHTRPSALLSHNIDD